MNADFVTVVNSGSRDLRPGHGNLRLLVSKPVVIVNPRSGGGLGEKAWARLAGPIALGLGPFDVRFTERGGHATEIAALEAAGGRELVVAVGGDGTISEVTQGLLRSGAANKTHLGIIPRGTGGDFRRTLDLPRDAGQAAAHIAGAAPRVIDVGRVTLTDENGGTIQHHFINVASFGFSAAVADRANRSSKRLGAKAAFLGATLRSLVSYDNVDVYVTLDDAEPMRRTLLFGALGNGQHFGGGMKICPGARLDDGLLDVVLVGNLSRSQVVRKTNRLYDGTHLSMPEVTHAQAKRIHVASADPAQTILIEMDGETTHGGTLPATFEILPGALTLRG